MPNEHDDEALTDTERFQKLYPIKPKDALEQAAQFLGFMSGIEIDLGDGTTWTLPNPSLMDDETEDRYNQALVDLELEAEKYDRAPDVKDDKGKFVRKGDILMPARIDGKVVPNRDVRIAKALMGDEVYAKFKKAGGRASQITIHWQQMGKFMRDRAAADSKSGGSTGVVAPVPNGADV